MNRRKAALVIIGVLILGFFLAQPSRLFDDPVSTIIVDRDGNLLGARIARDEQWRFPRNPEVSEWFTKAVICFEDKRFYNHPGIDPLAMLRAIRLNIEEGKVVSGGSTITMQVIRLSRKGQSRTFMEKFIEVFLALRLELWKSKDEILSLYAANAPFGGNIVGLDAAAWKYFERPADRLSLGQMATLAVLPNAPGLIHPNKNRDLLRKKRNDLLDRMLSQGIIDTLSCRLAQDENLPDRAKPLPELSSHLLQRIIGEKSPEKRESIVKTTISLSLQSRLNELALRHHGLMKQSGINNLAAIVTEVSTGDVLAYVGNVPFKKGEHGFEVDIIGARRSSGSVFKPILYADMFGNGELMPKALLPDIPSYYSGYTPKNFDYTYSGAVPVNEALYRSLNVPAIRALSDFGINRFANTLKKVGFTTIDKPASHYGLSLAVGGAECTLWDLARAYTGMSKTLVSYAENKKYPADAYRQLNYYSEKSIKPEEVSMRSDGPLTAAGIWEVFEAMTELKRPGAESYWKAFSSSGRVSWKTGTSFGFRDAWAVGCTPEYVVAVWCGNADGEGRPGLVGVRTAGPFMFDIFNTLSKSNTWFTKPVDDMKQLYVCTISGFKAGPNCDEKSPDLFPANAERSRICPYHKMIHLDPTEKWRVHDACESPQNMISRSFFNLPPAMEKYYKSRNPNYHTLPDYRQDCISNNPAQQGSRSMQFIYPNVASNISIPIQLDETKSSVVFEVTHQSSEAILYWHLDDTYIGRTKEFHDFALNPSKGQHIVTVVDQNGDYLSAKFRIVE